MARYLMLHMMIQTEDMLTIRNKVKTQLFPMVVKTDKIVT